MDLIATGGPVMPCFAKNVPWQRETVVLNCSAGTPENTSEDQANVYRSLAARDGFAWKQMAAKAGIAEADLGSLGLAGFSAFHGFANNFLKNAEDYAKCSYVHLADACFEGAGATTPFAGYAQYAADAATGNQKMMVATTNGPWGKSLSYPNPVTGGMYNLTSGAQCFELVWNAAVSAGVTPTVPEAPSGIPAPTRAVRVGNLLWFHYETFTPGLPRPCGGDDSAHAWHVNVLATPYMVMYGAPWMAGKRPGLFAGGGGDSDPAKSLLVAGATALAAYFIVRAVLRFAS